MNKENIVEMLKEGVCEVTFTKTDGSKRVMQATLQSDVVEKHIVPLKEGATKRETPSHLLAVIDVENDAWRSFKIDSVISVEKVDG